MHVLMVLALAALSGITTVNSQDQCHDDTFVLPSGMEGVVLIDLDEGSNFFRYSEKQSPAGTTHHLQFSNAIIVSGQAVNSDFELIQQNGDFFLYRSETVASNFNVYFCQRISTYQTGYAITFLGPTLEPAGFPFLHRYDVRSQINNLPDDPELCDICKTFDDGNGPRPSIDDIIIAYNYNSGKERPSRDELTLDCLVPTCCPNFETDQICNPTPMPTLIETFCQQFLATQSEERRRFSSKSSSSGSSSSQEKDCECPHLTGLIAGLSAGCGAIDLPSSTKR